MAFDEQIVVGRKEVAAEPERAILVGIERVPGESQYSMQELLQLVHAAGASVVDVVVQTRAKPDPATFVGKGKLAEIREHVAANDADMVVFNGSLLPRQILNVLDILECKVLDRVELILDIFAQHAHSREGKLQVELALLTYLLPRLVGRGKMMSRIGGGRHGGVGVRGPGRTKLEMDRLQLRRRIARLRHKLVELGTRRDTERAARRESGMPLISIVGYTNAGKSSLLNALAGSEEVAAHDRLFETLDPTVRQVDLGEGVQALASDTVGFIRNMPRGLLAAFQSTLEEAVQADILIEVVDASNPQAAEQHRTGEEILGSLAALDKPRVVVLNKWDMVAEPEAAWERLHRIGQPIIALSATEGTGLDELKMRLCALVRQGRVVVTIHLPYERMELLNLIHQRGHVLSSEYQPDYVAARVEVDQATLGQLQPFIVRQD